MTAWWVPQPPTQLTCTERLSPAYFLAFPFVFILSFPQREKERDAHTFLLLTVDVFLCCWADPRPTHAPTTRALTAGLIHVPRTHTVARPNLTPSMRGQRPPSLTSKQTSTLPSSIRKALPSLKMCRASLVSVSCVYISGKRKRHAPTGTFISLV